MRAERSLRARIVWAYMLLTLLLCGLFGTVTYVSFEIIENQLVKVRLIELGDQMIENRLKGVRLGLNEPGVLSDERIPTWLRGAAPGVHELTVDGEPLHVLIRDYGDKRYAIVHNETNFERLEWYVLLALAAVCATCLLTAFLFGSATASRVIRPVTQLSDAVRENRLAALPALDAADELGDLARAFAVKSEEMQRLLLRERLFTGDVSHELRTPLTVILGAAELLQARPKDRTEAQAALERIRRTAVETAERVSALLMLSRAPESIKVPLADVQAIVKQEVERCRPLLQDKPVELSMAVEGHPHAFGRPELIGIAVGNLVRNACQFTEQGHVRIKLTPRELTVEDSGPGIAEDLRGKLFDRFVRAAPDSVAGTGLGLAIVRRVCEHLGWQVELTSLADGGSRFTIHFATLQSALSPPGLTPP